MNTSKINYKGKDYSVRALACHLRVAESTLHYRMKKYGTEAAIQLCTLSDDEIKEWRRQCQKEAGRASMSQRIKKKYATIEYKGVKFSSSQLARLFGVRSGTFSSWTNRYGIDEAIKRGEMTEEERQEEKLRAMRQGMKQGRLSMNKPLPANDPDYELKNRINSWRQQGWSDDEIIVKASMI